MFSQIRVMDTQTGVGCPTPVFGYRTTRQLLLLVIFDFFELGIHHIILRLSLLLLTGIALGMGLVLGLLLGSLHQLLRGAHQLLLLGLDG